MSAGPWRLDHLARFGPRAGPNMRPTLLRVLTELYLQKPTHTADEERHYTELALRLLDAVDAGTRATIAERLARYPSPPMRVIERIAGDLPEVAAWVHAPVTRRQLPSPFSAAERAAKPNGLVPFPADIASELDELFFAANADERRLILLNLDVIAPFPTERVQLSPAAELGDRLEAAVLSRNREAFAQQLAQALQISRAQARRLADDDLGEPIVTAAKAVNIGRGALYRMLLFVNMKSVIRSLAFKRSPNCIMNYRNNRPSTWWRFGNRCRKQIALWNDIVRCCGKTASRARAQRTQSHIMARARHGQPAAATPLSALSFRLS